METGDSPRATSIVWGALISVAAFILLLWALGLFIPRFLRFADTPYAKLLPLASVFVILGSVAIQIRRRKARRQKD